MSKSGGWGAGRGVTLPAPIFTRFKAEGKTMELRSQVPFARWRTHPYYFQDFIGRFTAPPDDVFGRTVQTAGVPTATVVADDPDGSAAGVLAATSELELAGFDWNDMRAIPANKFPFFQALVKLSAALDANGSAVIGLGSDFNSTFNTIAVSAWFRVNGSATPNLTLLAETDDTVTDTDAQATGVTLVAAEYNLFTIDTFKVPGRALFYVNDNLVANLPWTAPPATTLQPMVYIRKTTGTAVPVITLDLWAAEWQRSSLPG